MKKIIKSMLKNEGNIYRTIVNKNINHLYLYIKGFIYYGEINESLSQEEKLFKNNFSQWVCKYYERRDLSTRWDILILFKNYNSVEQALDVFLKLYKEWHKEEFGEDAW